MQRKLFNLDTEFHASVIGMIGNIFLVERYRDICQRIFLRFRTDDLKVERISEIVRQHDELFEAIQIRDVERAKALIRNHYADSKKNLFAIIFQKEERIEKLQNRIKDGNAAESSARH